MARSLLLGTALQSGALTVGLAFAAHAQPLPNARPTGGVVVAGAASISQTSAATTISQSSPRAAVNWQSFDVGSQQSVTFNQPSASAITLNRVKGPNPSQIAGSINANGQIVLVNQSGVTFYKGAQVNTNGLMVSAAGISNRNFMAGRMKFNRPANPDALIVNAGTITIAQAGLAALVAPQVANSGVITANLGHVVLAGATTATLDLYGDGLVSLDVNNAVIHTPAGATALVTNSGIIQADGGTVQLTARAADGIVQSLVDAGGTIRAATAGAQTGTIAQPGTIALNGIGGSIVVTGQLAATGTAPGSAGGSVEIVSSGNVTVASTAHIDASGSAGGGVVAIGTTLARAAGGPSVTAKHTAANVTVQQGATITANAIDSGNGGRIAVLSDGVTEMGGMISATGGARGGNGGFVETSGVELGVTGAVDLAAPEGSLGTWLLDPDYLNVVSGSSGNSEDRNFIDGGGTIIANDGSAGTPDTISNGIINGSSADVVLQARDTLSVDADIALTFGANQSLVLDAGGTLTIASGVNVSAPGNVTLATGGAGPASPTPPTAQPSPLINVAGTVSSGTGSVSLLAGTNGTISIPSGGSVAAASVVINSGSGGVTIGGSVGQTGGAIDITSAGPVTEQSGAAILASTLTSSGGIHGTANLAGSNNLISTIGNIAVTGGDLNVVDATSLTLAGALSANNLFFQVTQTDGALTLGQASLVGPPTPATLTTPAGGRISLVADNISVGAATSSITTNGGTVEIAPNAAIAESILSGGGLLVGAPLLSIISTSGGTLDIGGFTDAPIAAPNPVASASSVDIGAAFDVSPAASTLRLDATGDITQSGGALNTTFLAGSGGAWTLNNTNNIVPGLGTITATTFALTVSSGLSVNGDLAARTSATLNVAGGLAVNGLLGSPAVQLTAANINIPGTLDAASANLMSAGTIAGTGTLTIAQLSGNAAGSVSLTGNNSVPIVQNFTAGSFTLNTTSVMTLAGTLNAASIALSAPGTEIVLEDGAEIVTGGNLRPPGPIQPGLEPANGAAGAYLQAPLVVQIGSVTVAGQGGGPATVQISSGTVQFDPPLGFSGPSTWLILNLGAGSAAGNVFVNALDVAYTIPGSANLTGTLAGISGGAAAAAGFIQPAVNSNYTFNGCVIASVTCGSVTPPSTPPTPTPIPPVGPIPPTPPSGTTPIGTTPSGNRPSDNTLALAETSTLGGIYHVLPDVTFPLAALPGLVVLALPVPPVPLPQLTDPDVVPPNIATVDY